MWSTAGLFPRLCDPDHLDRAAALTVRGKRHRPDVAWLLFRREEVLTELAQRLADGAWRPRGYELTRIFDPKPRVITRVPIEDRVVHTAVVSLLLPTLTRSLRPEAMACRPGLGAHRAVLRVLRGARSHRFCVHLDVRAYFPSIDRGILRGLLARRVRDARFLAVVDHILEAGAGLYDRVEVRDMAGLPPDWPPAGRGLPIGAYTSQVFAAHLYLDALDHFIKRELKVPGYVRYVDDLFLFGDGRAELRRWRDQIARWLDRERGLRLKHPAARVLSCAGTIDALGFEVRRAGLRVRRRALRRFRQRVAAGRPGLPASVRATAALVAW